MTITISPTAEDLRTTADRLALRVADLVRERDIANGEARDAIGTGLQFKAERDQARADAAESRQAALDLQLENAALTAATFVLVADSIRREEALTAEVAKARGEARMFERISNELQDALDDEHLDNRRSCEELARLAGENRRLLTAVAELDELKRGVAQAAGRRLFRRRR